MGEGRFRGKLMPKVLLIGGTDSSGGAGLVADIETIINLGGTPTISISSITAQTNAELRKSHAVELEIFEEQLNTNVSTGIDAIKIGVLPTPELTNAVVNFLKVHPCKKVVLDPVVYSSSGGLLVAEDTLDVMKKKLFPLCSLITPNLEETSILTGRNSNIMNNPEDVSGIFFSLGANAVLIKGGHANENICKDFLIQKDNDLLVFKTERKQGATEIRGTGCRLASAIAFFLASGISLNQAIEKGRHYLQSFMLGKLCLQNES